MGVGSGPCQVQSGMAGHWGSWLHCCIEGRRFSARLGPRKGGIEYHVSKALLQTG